MIQKFLNLLDVLQEAIPFCMLMIIFCSVVYIAIGVHCSLRRDKRLRKEVDAAIQEEREKQMVANIMNYARKTNNQADGGKDNTCEKPKIFADLVKDICNN
jgi:hypothetical protein